MTLPTGTISMSQVNTELGRSATATISLNEAAVRSLAGVPSGAISMDNLRGKSAVTFSPDGGTSAGAPVELTDEQQDFAYIEISCTQNATWNWSKTGSFDAFASVESGQSASSIFFSLSTSSQIKQAIFTVSGTAGGITRYYKVTLVAYGNN